MKQQKDKYKDNESNAWALIYGQCSPELKNKLKGMSRYDNVKADKDVVKLLTMIRGYCCQFDTLNNKYMSICKITNEPLLLLPESRIVKLQVPQQFHGAS